MAKKIVVLGAGIAGCVAYHTLKHENIRIVEKRHMSGLIPTHDAIMRLRNPAVADLIGANYKKVTIEKGIWFKNRFCFQPTILMNNMYSIKLYGTLGKRSILKPGSSERYILKGGFPAPELNYNSVVNIRDGKINLSDGSEMAYDYCISTLPMPNLYCVIAGRPEGLDINFNAKPVFVDRWKLKKPTGLNQTIIYPDPSIPVYRITLQDDILIVEGIEALNWKIVTETMDLIKDSFGIPRAMIGTLNPNSMALGSKKMELGKIIPVDEDSRLKYIMWLTDTHRIFSFGRFATWRSLRTDHLMNDIKIIKKIISAKDTADEYKNRML